MMRRGRDVPARDVSQVGEKVSWIKSSDRSQAARRRTGRFITGRRCLLLAVVLAALSIRSAHSTPPERRTPALFAESAIRSARPLPVPGQQAAETTTEGLQQPWIDDMAAGPLSPVSLRQAPQQDEVAFAGQSIRTRVPAQWNVREQPFGREVRLVMAPEEATFINRMPRDGVWFCFHPQAEPPAADAAPLRAFLTERLRTAETDAQPLSEPTPMQLGGWWGYRQDYSAPPAPGDLLAGQAVRGFHFVTVTSWGICELHTVCAESMLVARQAEWQALVDATTLEQQPIAAPIAVEQARDAELILGSWKSFRSRFRLYADGKIEISLDPKNPETVDRSQPAQVLRGRYEAHENVLFVTWDDGSRTNYRWRLDQDSLLLTDHDGQISELRRLLE
jgi:hypothetical protein